MRTHHMTALAASALLGAGVLGGCAGGSIPVAEQHPGGPDIGAILSRQNQQQGFKTSATSGPAADATASRAGPAIANFPGTPSGMASHAVGMGHGGGGGGGGGSGAAGGGH